MKRTAKYTKILAVLLAIIIAVPAITGFAAPESHESLENITVPYGMSSSEEVSYTGGKITAFADLGADIAVQNVPIGTQREDLDLPETLNVTLENKETVNVSVKNWAEDIPYISLIPGEVIFTPSFGSNVETTEGITLPTISVTVGNSPGGISLFAFDGVGTILNPLSFSEPYELVELSENWNNGNLQARLGSPSKIYFALTGHIDMLGYNYTPWGNAAYPFSGVLNGNGHLINNLKITVGNENLGLFGELKGAHISQVGIINAEIRGLANVGVLGGIADDLTLVDQVYTTGKLNATTNAAGIIGSGGAIKNSISLLEYIAGNTVAYITNDGTQINTYTWDGTSIGGSRDNPTPLSTADFQAGTTIWATAEFDSNVWAMMADNLPIASGAPDSSLSVLPGYLFASTELYGSGTLAAPYIIYDKEDLEFMRDRVNIGDPIYVSAYYKLMNDIDLSGVASWVPIGDVTNSFKGNFNGNNKVIKNLTITGTVEYAGLFGFTDASTIQDLGVEDVTIDVNPPTAFMYVGGLVGTNEGSIKNCYSTGRVINSSSIACTGGLVGLNYSGGIEDCYSTASVKGKNQTGGLAGQITGGVVKNCYSTGSVEGSSYVGGLVGYYFNGSVQSCYSTSSVEGITSVGGLVGSNSSASITNCMVLNQTLTATGGTYVNRVVGESIGGTVQDNYAWDGMALTPASTGGFDENGADVTSADIINNSIDLWVTVVGGSVDTAIWHVGKGKLPVLVGVGGKQDGQIPWYIGDTVTGLPQVGSVYQISTVQELMFMRDKVNAGTAPYVNAEYKLMNDLDLSGINWVPIGDFSNRFNGIFDGGSKVIKGLTITGDVPYAGLFGYINNTVTIKNLGVENVNIAVTTDANITSVGGLVGYSTGGTIKDCYSTGCVEGLSSYSFPSAPKVNVGGLMGAVIGGSVQGCYSTASANGTATATNNACVGGLVGENMGSVENCYSTGSVEGSSSSSSATNIGGLVGANSNAIKTCYSTGSVKGDSSSTWYRVGGLAGYNSGTVTNCVSLNQTLTATGTGMPKINRVVGENNGVTVQDNHAWDGMALTPAATNAGSAQNGTDVTLVNIASAGFWTDTVSDGTSGFADSTVWTVENGKLPVLKKLTEQDGTLPEYLSSLEGYLGGQTPIPGSVEITGTVKTGQTVTAEITALTGDGGLAYQWYVDNVVINGAIGNTYTVQTSDQGKNITVMVSTNNYTGELLSAARRAAFDVTGVSLNITYISILTGSTETLMAIIAPANATNQNVSWSSSDPSVATVNSTGTVTAVKAGTAIITVTTVDGSKSATCIVTVSDTVVNVTGVNLNKTFTSILTGSTEMLTATVAPANATNQNLTWGSSDTAIATVNSTGTVTAVKAGTAIITVTTLDGGKTASCAVTVTDLAIIGDTTAKSSASSSGGSSAVDSRPSIASGKYGKEQFLKDWNNAVKALGVNETSVVIRGINYSSIDGSVLDFAYDTATKANLSLTFRFDEVVNKDVVTRLYVVPTEKNESRVLKSNISSATKIQTLFGKFFANKVEVLSYDEASTGMGIAHKLPKGVSADSVIVYGYDIKANRYTKLTNADQWVDANGYLHFTAPAGNVIISDGELVKK